MEISKPVPADPSQSRIVCRFHNLHNVQMENLVFQAAVPKYLKLEMLPPSSTTIPARSQGEVTQEIKLVNSMQGQKAIMLKLKIAYKQGDTMVSVLCMNHNPKYSCLMFFLFYFLGGRNDPGVQLSPHVLKYHFDVLV